PRSGVSVDISPACFHACAISSTSECCAELERYGPFNRGVCVVPATSKLGAFEIGRKFKKINLRQFLSSVYVFYRTEVELPRAGIVTRCRSDNCTGLGHSC